MAEPTARGAWQAKQYVLDFLAANLPAHLAAVRAEWELAVHEMPDPAYFSNGMPQAVSLYPTIAATATRMPRTHLRGHDDTNVRAVESTYSIQLFFWIRYESQTPGDVAFERVQHVRDDYAAAIRNLLLTTPSLGGGGTSPARLAETTMVEDYSDVQPVTGERAVAAAYLGFDVRVQEQLARPELSIAGTVTPETYRAGPGGTS